MLLNVADHTGTGISMWCGHKPTFSFMMGNWMEKKEPFYKNTKLQIFTMNE